VGGLVINSVYIGTNGLSFVVLIQQKRHDLLMKQNTVMR